MRSEVHFPFALLYRTIPILNKSTLNGDRKLPDKLFYNEKMVKCFTLTSSSRILDQLAGIST